MNCTRTPTGRPPAARKPGRAVLEEARATIRRLKNELARLRRVALRDPLTGLLNRRGMEHELLRACALAARRNGSVGLILADLDGFKRINDTHGHPAGDRVLRECAAVLRKNLRVSDSACRYGGDEMAVILPFADAQQTRDVAERLSRAVRNHPFRHGRKNLRLTLSAGCGCATPRTAGTTPEALIEEADQALRRAKQAAGPDP